ncbi:MAG: hypothetical protein DMG67_03740, partial [Acidobacteria bacterium]
MLFADVDLLSLTSEYCIPSCAISGQPCQRAHNGLHPTVKAFPCAREGATMPTPRRSSGDIPRYGSYPSPSPEELAGIPPGSQLPERASTGRRRMS